MRISGTEPSSVILSQNELSSKNKKRCPKRAKTSWSQKGWCNKPTQLQFQTINCISLFILALKLVRTYFNYRVLETSTAVIFLSIDHYLYALIISDDVMDDFNCMGPVDLPGALQKRQNSKWKILAHRETPSLIFVALCFTDWGFWWKLSYKFYLDTCIYRYLRCQCIHGYASQSDF